jgi:hypothetical protein
LPLWPCQRAVPLPPVLYQEDYRIDPAYPPGRVTGARYLSTGN